MFEFRPKTHASCHARVPGNALHPETRDFSPGAVRIVNSIIPRWGGKTVSSSDLFKGTGQTGWRGHLADHSVSLRDQWVGATAKRHV